MGRKGTDAHDLIISRMCADLAIIPQEIEAFFRQFDADGSGKIERKELKACLYSLGEVRRVSQWRRRRK